MSWVVLFVVGMNQRKSARDKYRIFSSASPSAVDNTVNVPLVIGDHLTFKPERDEKIPYNLALDVRRILEKGPDNLFEATEDELAEMVRTGRYWASLAVTNRNCLVKKPSLRTWSAIGANSTCGQKCETCCGWSACTSCGRGVIDGTGIARTIMPSILSSTIEFPVSELRKRKCYSFTTYRNAVDDPRAKP